ncbi:polyprenol phosphomannose-dependent alpha 1,6 mannosyltransferase MptB [Nocardioides solisilvae]|uniref:polyprenol phosphomannose-dependent alpha 1,6 mannosyltransferase MptB n=1 Tax=Nocardioides solisilvae TaxID=1542435 RepID=UPI000D74F3D9|nr:polyprenol phosphomannose-dependent alpha 1,6 mannosyltransferase MptB [Nocardioides solisilvae]
MVAVACVALVVAVERRSWVLGAVLVGVAAAVKLPAALVGLGVALATVRRHATTTALLRRLAGVAAVAVGTLVGLGALAGLGVGWLHALGVPGTVRTPLSLPTQLGRLGNLLGGLVLPGDDLDLVPVVRAAATVAALGEPGWLALRTPRGVPAEATRAVAWAVLWLVVLSPVVHHWYVLWFLPLLAATALGRRGDSALLHVGWLGGLVAPLDSSLAGAGSVIAVAVALVAVGSVLQVLQVRRDDDRVRRSARVRPRPAPRAGRASRARSGTS